MHVGSACGRRAIGRRARLLDAVTRAALHVAQSWCELLCWCHLVWDSVLMYENVWDAELVGSMQVELA